MVVKSEVGAKVLKLLNAVLLLSIACATLLVGWLSPSVMSAETCEEWVGEIVSAQGSVEIRRAGEVRWVSVALNDRIERGDMLRIQQRSRAAILLCNGAVLRLDHETTITLTGLDEEQTFTIKLLKGAAHFFSRIRRGLKVATPFVNGSVEGTEFYVRVGAEETFLSIFEGRVLAANDAGTLILESGQSAVAQKGQAPILRIVVRPRDAVQWALHYPAVSDYCPEDFAGDDAPDWQKKVKSSMQFYREGNLVKSFKSLEGIPESIRDPRFFTYRGGLLLVVGRVDQASSDIERALDLDPDNGDALALQSVVFIVQNQKDKALNLAQKAVETEPQSSAARIALSYAKQAHFDLKGALESVQEALKGRPENPLLWARLAELWLSLGYLDRAENAAQKAVALNPNLALTQTVLGFAYLTSIKTRDSRTAFERAIELDQAAPLPRLGLGLAKIREGELKAGRGEIEIAVSLDPNNSLIRSYMGKAYFDEKRDEPAKDEFATAKELDPKNPTPWYYDAILKQTLNRPVEALNDLQKSIELNDNRAVYRSRLLLDEDLAARSASIGRIYHDLGFQQMALVEGWKSVNTDPVNYSAHRFLADTYNELPRHEIAKASELVQSQLLQPININPIQPQLAESNLSILEGAGPADPSFNEFNSLFLRNRFALQASGVAGENESWGDELVQSAVWGRFSYSLGQFHYETDGFRENNDQDQDIYDVFAQMMLSPATSIQAELRHKDIDKGDLLLRFDPNDFLNTLRQEEEFRTARIGIHHAFTPRSHVIGSIIYQEADFDTRLSDPIDLRIKTEDDGYLAEGQYLFRSERFDLISGVGHFDADRDEVTAMTIVIPAFPPFIPEPIEEISESEEDSDIRHTNYYVYSLLKYPDNFIWTVGGSADFFDGGIKDRDQFNPKIGLLWNPFPDTTIRAAAFRTLTRSLISSQTIEPTQVAGFNQFFDDTEATKAWRYGVGIDQRFSHPWYVGAEFSKRDLDVPLIDLTTMSVRETDRDEYFGRAYLFWTPFKCLALSGEYQFEKFERAPDAPGEEAIVELKTHRFPLGVRFFHPDGFFAKWKATYVNQDGDFGNSLVGVASDDDQFWVFDASIGYRLPKRFGLIELELRNMFDEDFKFQDTDPKNPRILPDSMFVGRITLSF